MQRITPITTDHQLILEGLDVLRLIVNRLETDEFVEPEDITAVLSFLRDVGCECLERTEQLLLRPALLRAKKREHVQRLKTALARHAAIRPLFDDTAAGVTSRKHFVLRVHLLTKLVGDLILEEDHSLLQAAVDLLGDPEGQLHLEKFREQERGISGIAVRRSPSLRRLETKYAYPHCV